MAISYPLAVSAFWEQLRLAARPKLVPMRNGKQSQDGAGNQLTAFRGSPKWGADVVLSGGRHDRNQTQEADIAHLTSRDGTFLAYDVQRPFPAADPQGAFLDAGSLVLVGGEAASGNVVLGAYRYEGQTVTLSQAASVVCDAGTRFNVSGLIESISANTLRVDYDPVTHVPSGILIESGFTNLLKRSREFDHSDWTKLRATVTANVSGVTDPWGTQLAEKIVEDTSVTNSHMIYQSYTTSSFVNHVVYILAKAAERTKVRLSLGNFTSTEARAIFDLAAGTISTVISGTGDLTGAAALMRDLGNGWYWCELTALKVAGDPDCVPLISLCDASGNNMYTGDGVSGLYIAHAQMEAGSLAHMPVVTTSAAVARAADTLTIPARGTNGVQLTYDDGSQGAIIPTVGNFSIGGAVLARPRVKAWKATRTANPSAASVQVKTKGANNRSLSLKGLPPFYTVTKGDKLSIAYGSGKFFYAEAMETAVADGAGDTAEFEIQPFLATGTAVNDAVTLKKAPVKCKIVVDSYRPSSGQGNLEDGGSFSMVSVP